MATGDVNGDGIPDLIVAAGPGGGPEVKVYDGATWQLIDSFFAYEPSFTGGVYVAVADLAGSGVSQIITGTGNGGGPLVDVYDATGRLRSGFFAYESTFRGGVTVAAGDVQGSGALDIVTGAGPGGAPRVRAFNSQTLAVVADYMAFDPTLRTGVYVAAGDLTGAGYASIIAGPGSYSVPTFNIRDSATGVLTSVTVSDIGIINGTAPSDLADSDALSGQSGVSEFDGGLRVSVVDANPQGTMKNILVARGPGFISRIHEYSLDPSPTEVSNLVVLDGYTGGVYVG
ncbi:Alkaline phosphatase [Fimbriiglobus ruber]|uniref:Alkaline phosphatase n=1 Tax=Fimbriiglobus ruber TaxID=1908690 RepID=A0A225D8M0_9BACT|nr:Alkaline phosphatase [Fimbriiglobus ruber]